MKCGKERQAEPRNKLAGYTKKGHPRPCRRSKLARSIYPLSFYACPPEQLFSELRSVAALGVVGEVEAASTLRVFQGLPRKRATRFFFHREREKKNRDTVHLHPPTLVSTPLQAFSRPATRGNGLSYLACPLSKSSHSLKPPLPSRKAGVENPRATKVDGLNQTFGGPCRPRRGRRHCHLLPLRQG